MTPLPPALTPASESAAPARRRSGVRTLVVVALAGTVLAAGAPSVITVRPGDTLWDLARRHGTSVSALQRLNDLEGRATIYAGQSLRVPGTAPARSRTRVVEASHLVVRGDTLTGIAKRYGTSSSYLIRRNKLPKDGTIVLGRRLAYPKRISTGGAPTRTTSTRSVPTTNAGATVSGSVRESVARHRAILAARSHPSKTAVRELVRTTAKRYGVNPSLAQAVAYHESGFQQRVVSGVDAIGVMQVLPSTGRALERTYRVDLDLLDTRDNVTAGILLLRELTRSVGSTDKVLAGYYQGLGSIRRKGVLPQTHAYIRNVTWLMKHRF